MTSAPTSAFFQLSERMRHGLVHRLGWRSLRPVQEVSFPPILAGENVLVLAPTAGGKTEAAVLPVLDRLGTGLGALFLSPLRALLNNQEPRLKELASLVGLEVFKWHGDVSAHLKKRVQAQLLMITPESLEVILTSGRGDMLANLSCVIVDEIHAFAGDDRGDHLLCLLERLRAYTPHDFQRIGLSATVGNPETLCEWLQGSSQRSRRVVSPAREPGRRLVEIHPHEEFQDPIRTAARLARGKKSLFFAESRGKVERVRGQLQELGVQALVHHSSLSREVREATELAFRSSSNCAIVCTRTLELGLDVGDLDLVLQLDAPTTVSGFLQRLGRTGRRDGARGHMAFCTDDRWSFLRAISLISLAARGAVEPVRPSRFSPHLFVHQVLTRVLEHRGLSRSALLATEGYCFADLTEPQRERILDHLLEKDILARADGRLVVGRQGEREFGRGYFRELYSVFEAPRELAVETPDGRRIGAVECWFAQVSGDKPFCFLLAGRAWRAVGCLWDRSVLLVEPAGQGAIPSWSGDLLLLQRDLCREMRSHLVEEAPVGFLSDLAQALLDRLRSEWRPLLSHAPVILERRGEKATLFTYAGGRINNVVGRLYTYRTGLEARADNLRVRLELPTDEIWSRPMERVLEELGTPLSGETLQALVKSIPRARASKFQPFLPPDLEAAFVAGRLLDLEGAMRLAAEDLGVVTWDV